MRTSQIKIDSKMKHQRYITANSGFTLLELLITVAIIAILASVAYPSYQDSVRKARRTDGIEAALTCAAGLKKLFTATNSFQGTRPPECDPNDDDSNLSKEKHYAIAIDFPTAITFTVTVNPQGDQAKDKCKNLSITNTGSKTAKGSTVEECWK